MANQIVRDPRWSAWNRDGTPCVGARLEIFQDGTETLAEIYSDYQMQVPATNPLIADERGLFPIFYTDDSVRYKVKITAPNGVVISQVDGLAL